MSSKSQTRNYLRDMVPNAFCQDALPNVQALSACEIAVHDSMQMIKAANVGNKTNWGQLVKAFSREVEYCFTHIPSVRTFVMVFDHYDRVPLAKSVEQRARSTTQSVGDGKHDLRDFLIAGLDEPIPETFNAATRDRRHWCREIIRFYVRSMAEHVQYAPPLRRPGDRLIVSGHYLSYGDLDIPVHPDAPLEFLMDDDMRIQLRFRTDLAHTLGEGDLAMLFIMHELARDMAPKTAFLMLSIDSDMLYMCLKFIHTYFKFNINIMMRYWPNLSWCVNLNPYFRIASMNPSVVYGQKWVDVGLLKEHIESLQELSSFSVEDRVPHVVVAANCAGNDYIDQIPWVPGNYFLDACLFDAKALGSLVRVKGKKWELVGHTYQRLLEYATRRAATRKEWSAKPGENCGPGFDVPKRMPRPNDRIYRKYHVKYWLIMISSIGESDFVEPPLHEFAYARKNRNKPVSYWNIKRLHTEEGQDDTFDEWDDQPMRPIMALPENSTYVSDSDLFGDFVPPFANDNNNKSASQGAIAPHVFDEETQKALSNNSDDEEVERAMSPHNGRMSEVEMAEALPRFVDFSHMVPVNSDDEEFTQLVEEEDARDQEFAVSSYSVVGGGGGGDSTTTTTTTTTTGGADVLSTWIDEPLAFF